jgi:hypothetical protein
MQDKKYLARPYRQKFTSGYNFRIFNKCQFRYRLHVDKFYAL